MLDCCVCGPMIQSYHEQLKLCLLWKCHLFHCNVQPLAHAIHPYCSDCSQLPGATETSS